MDVATHPDVSEPGAPNFEAKAAPISLRALGRLIGVTDKAIRNGIRSGRLRASIGVDAKGRPTVVDVDLARQEWTRNAGRVSPLRTAEHAASAAAGASSETLNEAQRLTTIERARKLRLENDLREGRLLDVATAAKEAFEGSRIIREAMLNIPARLSAELAAESDAGRVYLKLDAAIREALVSTADRLLAVGE